MGAGRTFEFLRELAEGSFGKVYLARMNSGEAFSSVVAVKLLHGPWAQNQEVLARVRDEARLLGRLRHRNIVRVDDLTVINGQCAIVMEYLEGADLMRVVNAMVKRRQLMPARSCFQSVAQVARALDAAWGFVPIGATEPMRLIHRDVKPSNIMLTADAVVKLLDFGTARAEFDARETETRSMTFGSRPYMAPERILRDEPDTPAVDVYAMGVTLYEILRGRQFGKAPLERQAFENHVDSRMDRLRDDLFGDYAPGVKALIRQAVSWEPELRPGARALAEELATLGRGVGGMELEEFAAGWVPHIVAARAAPQPPTTGVISLVGRVLPEDAELDTLAFRRSAGAQTSAPVLPAPMPLPAPPLAAPITAPIAAAPKPLVPGWLRTVGLAGLVVLLAAAGAKLLRALEEPRGRLDDFELRSDTPIEVKGAAGDIGAIGAETPTAEPEDAGRADPPPPSPPPPTPPPPALPRRARSREATPARHARPSNPTPFPLKPPRPPPPPCASAAARTGYSWCRRPALGRCPRRCRRAGIRSRRPSRGRPRWGRVL